MNDLQITTKEYKPSVGENKILTCLSSEKEYGSISELCEDAGVDRSAWYDALKKEGFVGKILNEHQTVLYASFPGIMNKIAKQALRGSFAHQKMILEILKVYSGDNPIMNIDNRKIEIVIKNEESNTQIQE